jgi:ABC-2 type transport system permease protein
MYALLFKTFVRQRSTIIGILFIIMSGSASIYIGQRFLKKQEAAIEHSAAFQKEFTHNYVKYVSDDLGLLLYYLRFSLANKPEQLAGVSIGQKDLNPVVQSLTIRNLENQKWDTDLINPTNLLLGNMDLGFVMIYLFPLLIIVFMYNLLSEEKEGGTWSLLRLHAKNPKNIIWKKLLIKMSVTYSLALLLIVAAIVILDLPLNSALLATILLLTLYLAFWAGLSFWVVSWKKDSSFNAVTMLALWVFLTILSPALVNSYISKTYPVPEALDMVVKQRQGYHEKWDLDKKATVDKFYSHYPQFQKYPLPDQQFSWLWYYAMHQMGDDDAASESKALEQKLWQRHQASNNIAMFFPTLHAQLSLNSLAQTDLKNHLLFLDSTKNFHEQTRLSFYDKIFEGKPVESVNWASYKLEYFKELQSINWIMILLPLLVYSMLLFIISERNLRRS